LSIEPTTYSKTVIAALASRLSLPLETASTAVVRLDERVARLGRVGEGYRARSDYQEACALRAIAGELVPIDDLVLVDAGSPIRLPTIELTRARIVLQARRSTAGRPPAWAWGDEALFEDRLVNVTRDELLKALGDVEWDEDERADQWREILAGLPPMPVMLQAAVAWDAWLQIEPLQNRSKIDSRDIVAKILDTCLQGAGDNCSPEPESSSTVAESAEHEGRTKSGGSRRDA